MPRQIITTANAPSSPLHPANAEGRCATNSHVRPPNAVAQSHAQRSQATSSYPPGFPKTELVTGWG
jgi:hypothetical protein